MAQRIVIVGGGFAGLNLAGSLAKNKNFDITLVDKNNYNFFPPLIYQVSTGFLDPSSISYPFRNLFLNKKNVHFFMGELLHIASAKSKIILDSGELEYDKLIIATGTKTNYFGLENLQKHAIPMKTLEDALNMRNLLLQRLEKATKIKDSSMRLPWITMVIAGGGPTGVEISGIFAELRNRRIREEFPELVGAGGRIYLVNGGNELLSPMSEKSQKYTLEKLQKMGVEVMLNTRVVDYDGEKVVMKDGSHIYSKNLIWATGVTASRFDGLPEESYGHSNRLKVDAHNKVEGTTNIYAVGDTCIQTCDADYPLGHPQLAQVAIQQGKNLAKNLKNELENKPQKPFKYKDKGSLAIIGGNKAVADLPKLHFNGLTAWFIWVFVHLFGLINYRNRWRTFYNWSLDYFSDNQDLRLILRPDRRKSPKKDEV